MTAPLTSTPRWFMWALWGFATALFAYSVGRVLFVPLTFDEVWTLESYATAPWGDILSFKQLSANNHLANSLLMKMSIGLFGQGPVGIRLPNLLSHLVYLGYGLALARQLRHPFWIAFAFLALNLHPYLLDFFALGRGYGINAAMVLAALYHLFTYHTTGQGRHLWMNAIFAALAVLANLSAIHFLLADGLVVLALVIDRIRTWNGDRRHALATAFRHLLPLVITWLALFLFLAKPVRALINAGELYYGGGTGFWTDTVFSLCHATIYKIDYWRHDVAALQVFVLLLLIGMFVTFAIELSERGAVLHSSPGLLALLILLSVAASVSMQHFILDSPFLIYRTAMFLLPIFGLGLAWMLQRIAHTLELRLPSAILTTILAGAMFLNCALACNWKYAAEWPADADTPQMLADLQADYKAQGSSDTTRLALSWELRPVTNYYIARLGLTHIPRCTNDGCQPGAQYYFVLDEGNSCKLTWDQLPFGERQGHTLLHTYPISGTALWRAKPQ